MKKSLALPAVAVAVAAVGCGKGGSTPAAATQEGGGGGAQTTQQQRFPGANGEIAAIDGRTLQVQSTTDQTAVTYSPATTITDTVAATAASVTVGSCVVVRDSSSGVRPTARATITPDPSATRPTQITAVSVAVSAPVAGACTGGRTAGQGGFAGPQGTPPPGFTPPSGGPGGSRRGFSGGGAFGGAFGKVTSTSAGGFVVTGQAPGQTATTFTTTVTTTATTTYTQEKKATAAALKVGECVSARGRSDSSGTVAATFIAIRPKTDGTCSGGFGGPRG